jgi:hypothetical protein
MLSKEQIQTLIWKLAQEERNWLFDESPRNSGMVEPVLSLPACAENKPLDGVQYLLTGGPGEACISNGNTWAESRIK